MLAGGGINENNAARGGAILAAVNGWSIPPVRLALAPGSSVRYFVQTHPSGGPPVPRIRPTQDIRPLGEFRANLAAVVAQVRRTKRPVILTQHGRSAAVLMDAGEYESLLERVELLQDVRLAEQQVARGEGSSHTRARAAVLARLRS